MLLAIIDNFSMDGCLPLILICKTLYLIIMYSELRIESNSIIHSYITNNEPYMYTYCMTVAIPNVKL